MNAERQKLKIPKHTGYLNKTNKQKTKNNSLKIQLERRRYSGKIDSYKAHVHDRSL